MRILKLKKADLECLVSWLYKLAAEENIAGQAANDSGRRLPVEKESSKYVF